MGEHGGRILKPSVGRIVHYYTGESHRQYNGQGRGPYPALVLRAFEGTAATLKVMTEIGDYVVGSVDHHADAMGKTPEGEAPNRFWVWPPQV